MIVLTTNLTTLDRLVPENSQPSSSIKIAQSMNSNHVCPCCAHPLLRHIGLGKLYWRCNHCYQAMPVMNDAKEMPLFVTHLGAFQQLLVLIPLLQTQQNCEQESCERSISNLAITSMMIRSD